MPRPSVEELLRSSLELADSGRLEDALARADAAVKTDRRSVAALTQRASLLAELGRTDDALADYESALGLDKRDPEALLGAADLLITGLGDEGESLEEGLALCKRGLAIVEKLGDEQLAAEFRLLQAVALNELGDPRGALERLERAGAVLGDDPEWAYERGLALFELCRFDEARAAFEAVARRVPEHAWAHHHLGLLAERRGDQAEAARRFAEARSLAPDELPEPITLSESEFDAAVEAALERLPEPVRRYLGNVAIAVEPFPPVEDLLDGDPPLSPTILGVFRGSPLKDKASSDPWAHFPSSIVLYQRNLERFAHDREDLIEQIDTTLLHEVGHFLGFDEEDLEERGLD